MSLPGQAATDGLTGASVVNIRFSEVIQNLKRKAQQLGVKLVEAYGLAV